jgi:hypothetical protein
MYKLEKNLTFATHFKKCMARLLTLGIAQTCLALLSLNRSLAAEKW